MLGYEVHDEDALPWGPGRKDGISKRPVNQATTALPANAARLHNIIHVANHMMSHILHFYHLVALDYVKPVAWNVGGSGVFTPLTRPFLAPRYDDSQYINTARVLAIAPLLAALHPAVYKGDGSGVLETLPGWNVNPGDAINNYLTGQYLQALNIRRICHELQAIFSGRAPQCSGWTPGAATCTYKHTDIVKAQGLLAQIKAFVGEATDFANGIAGTMMFDVVAAAHLFPEYFWIGNSYGQFIAWGWGEDAGTIPLTGSMAAIYGASYTEPDNRAERRGYKLSAMSGAAWHAVDILNIGESVANSRYNKDGSGNYPNGKAFLHPWSGQTTPNPDKAYSWLKSPRYKHGSDYLPFEVGPLARMVVSGKYWGGVLSGFYPVTPVWGQAGPDLVTGDPVNPPYNDGGLLQAFAAALRGVYSNIPGVTGGPDLSGVSYNGDSVLDRIAGRALETRLMVDMAAHFLTQLDSTAYDAGGWSESGATAPKVPNIVKVRKGYGMSEASRGALSHWMKMKNGVITLYQAVVPTTWNASPKDILGQQGPAEKSVEGSWVANPAEAIELPRITHSYDFCIACAVHLVTPKGEVIKVDIPALPS